MPASKDFQSSTNTESTDIVAHSRARSTSTMTQSLSKPSRATNPSSAVRPPPATQTTMDPSRRQPPTRRQAAGDLEFQNATRAPELIYAEGSRAYSQSYDEPPPPYRIVTATPSTFNTFGHSTAATSTVSPATVSQFQASSYSVSNNNGRSCDIARPRGSKNHYVRRSSPQRNRASSNGASSAQSHPQGLSTPAALSADVALVTDKAKGWMRRLSNPGVSENDNDPDPARAAPAAIARTSIRLDKLRSEIRERDIRKELRNNISGVMEVECNVDYSRNLDPFMGFRYDEYRYAYVNLDSKENAEKAVQHFRGNGIWHEYHGRRKVKAKILK